MNEIEAILAAVDALDIGAQDAVLATVVRVRGSAYRRAGARMLLLPDGRRIGAISGGCLERDLCRKAWWLTSDDEPSLRVYDTTSEEDAVRAFGLGCNGVVDVLLERVSRASARGTLDFLKHLRASNQPGVVVHLIRDPAGGAAKRFFSTVEEAAHDPQAVETFLTGESRFVSDDTFAAFYEYVAPPTDIVIFGAGYDAVPLARFARALGWRVTLADAHPANAAVRFPGFSGVVPFEDAPVSERSVVVLMTHNYENDRDLLRRLLPAGPRYLGILGPRHRTEHLFADLGISSDWESVHAPVGLDIGGDSPEAIALSIVAEIQAVLAGRSGGMLRDRSGPIYRPMLELVT